MAESLGVALLELGTDDRKLKRGLGQAERSTRKSVDRMKKVFATLLTAAAVIGVVRSMDRVIDRLDRIGKQADKLGLTVEALQEMRFAAERSGIAITTFDMAFQRFVRRAGEAAKGTGEAKDALRELGFTLDDLRTKSPEELFQQAADALADTEDAANRLRLAFKLFDSEGVAIVNLVGNLRELRQEARDLGIVIGEDLVRDATRMKDAMTNAIAVIDQAWAFFVINFISGLDVIFGFLPETLDEQLGNRVDELRDLQEILAKPGVVKSSGAVVRELNERQDALLEEIRVISDLIDARKKAADFSPGGVNVTEKTGKAKDTFEDITDAIEAQISALEEQVLAFELQDGALIKNIALTRAWTQARREGLDLSQEQIESLQVFTDDLADTADRLIAIADAHRKANDAASKHNRQIERMSDAFADAVLEVRDLESAIASFQSLLMRFLSQQASSGLSGLFSGIAASIFGSGGADAALTAALSPAQIGLAHGGSFTVGGRGGVDQNLVQFRASRGEQVTVTPVGQSGGGKTVVNIFAPPGSTVDTERKQIGDIEELNFIIDAATAQNMRPGTQTNRALRAVYGSRQTLISR